MRILIIGGTGMLGHKLVQVLGEHHDVYALCRTSANRLSSLDLLATEKIFGGIDVRDFDAVRSAITSSGAEVVINAVGIVKQSSAAANILETIELNTVFPQKLAQTAQELGVRVISVSTDCVFDGKAGNYSETDTPNALDLYGQSKRWGEITGPNCLTIRTSIIGRELAGQHGLIEWFLSKKGTAVEGFTEAIFSGFPTIVLADIINALVLDQPELSGIYHISSLPISKYDLLVLAKESFDVDIHIEPSSKLRIDRSLNSERFAAVTGFKPESWPELMKRMVSDPAPYDKWKSIGR
ncbi:MAG: SDR family oxidoreductase [Acidobacteria bacterium]|nr:SDR family oxidoreductase [Acidobacteriota bacterium]